MDEPLVLLDKNYTITTLHNWIFSTTTNTSICVVDFWHEKCTHCPTALRKLNKMADNDDDVLYVACALATTPSSTADDALEVIADNYPKLHHVYMPFRSKETLKTELNFKTLPFCIIVQNNNIIWKGDPRVDEFVSVLKQHKQHRNKVTKTVYPHIQWGKEGEKVLYT